MNSGKVRNHTWLLISVILFCYCNTNAQGGTWVWMNGPDTLNGIGNYGTQGVASASNCPPAFYQAAQWKDKQGNLWIYGGEGAAPYQLPGDLWKYDPIVNMWTWVNGPGTGVASLTFAAIGIPSPANNPGARELGYPSWTDTSGDLWLWGGYGLCDLWRYNIASNEWTCMAYGYSSQGIFGNLYQLSDSAMPPYRQEENAVWTDANNNLWMFGGQRTDTRGSGDGNDLWRYNIALGQWAWMGGRQTLRDSGSYGTLGVESPANRPPARACRTRWTDSSYLYLTSGAGQVGMFNDVWRFNLNNNYWTWIGGDSGDVPTGQYTSYCSIANGDKPIGRWEERTARLSGCTPLLFMWGGDSDHRGYLNDLWSFDLSSNKWRWISGNDTGTFNGNFGAIGVPSATNMPRGSMGGCFWGDNDGHLWQWGGEGWGGLSNAMWEFIPDPACLPVDTSSLRYQLSRSSICNGDSALISFSGGYSLSVAPNSHVTWLDSLHALLEPDSTTMFTISGYTSCGVYKVLNFILPVLGSNSLSYQLSRTSICNGDSALISFNSGYSLSVTPNSNITWLDSLHALLKPDSTTVFTISGYTSCGDYNVQNFTLSVIQLAANAVSNKTSMCSGDTAQICATAGYTSYYWNTGDTATCIYVQSAGNYYVTVTDSSGCSANSTHLSIQVYPSSHVSISINGDTLSGYDAISYQWLLNGTPVTGANTSVYIATSPGSYVLEVTDSNGCIEKSNPLIISGIYENLFSNSISVFPNPTNTGWQLSVDPVLLGSMAEVFDATGRRIFVSAITNVQSTIDLVGAASGIYELRLTSHQYRVVRKLVKL